MAKHVQHILMTDGEVGTYIGPDGEIIVNQTSHGLHVQNGTTPGGLQIYTKVETDLLFPTLAGNNVWTGLQGFKNLGLRALDTDDSHYLIWRPGSNLTANRTLNVLTRDTDQTRPLLGAPITGIVAANGVTVTLFTIPINWDVDGIIQVAVRWGTGVGVVGRIGMLGPGARLLDQTFTYVDQAISGVLSITGADPGPFDVKITQTSGVSQTYTGRWYM